MGDSLILIDLSSKPKQHKTFNVFPKRENLEGTQYDHLNICLLKG